MLDAIERDTDQLAIIVAHEVAHLVARHHSFADCWSLPNVVYVAAGDLACAFKSFKAFCRCGLRYETKTARHKHHCCHASPH